MVKVIFIVSFSLLSLTKNEAADPMCATFALVVIEGNSWVDIERTDDSLSVSSPYPTQTFVDDLVGC